MGPSRGHVSTRRSSNLGLTDKDALVSVAYGEVTLEDLVDILDEGNMSTAQRRTSRNRNGAKMPVSSLTVTM